MASLEEQISSMLENDIELSDYDDEYEDDEVEVPEVAAKGKGSSGF